MIARPEDLAPMIIAGGARPSRSQEFLDTIAFGSMLVFASVMPPTAPRDAREPQALPSTEDDEARPGERPERAA